MRIKTIKYHSSSLLKKLGPALGAEHNCYELDVIIITLYTPLFNGVFSLLCKITTNILFIYEITIRLE